MSKNKNRRVQTPKPRNIAYAKAVQELRRSSATERHKSLKDYQRKPKHMGKGWDA